MTIPHDEHDYHESARTKEPTARPAGYMQRPIRWTESGIVCAKSIVARLGVEDDVTRIVCLSLFSKRAIAHSKQPHWNLRQRNTDRIGEVQSNSTHRYLRATNRLRVRKVCGN